MKINITFRSLFTVLFFAVLFGLTSYFSIPFTTQAMNSSKANSEKRKCWNEMEEKVNLITDSLGMKIDEEIKKTIIVLNLLGFKTCSSCEGHLNWGLQYPWIDFYDVDNQETEGLFEKIRAINNRIEKEESDIQKKYPNLALGQALQKEESKTLNNLYQETHLIRERIEKAAKTQLMPLNNLIKSFYHNRHANIDQIIIIHEMSPVFFRMYSIGGDWQVVRSEEEKASKMKEYQQEMKELTDFLTDYYFSNNTIKFVSENIE